VPFAPVIQPPVQPTTPAITPLVAMGLSVQELQRHAQIAKAVPIFATVLDSAMARAFHVPLVLAAHTRPSAVRALQIQFAVHVKVASLDSSSLDAQE